MKAKRDTAEKRRNEAKTHRVVSSSLPGATDEMKQQVIDRVALAIHKNSSDVVFVAVNKGTVTTYIYNQSVDS